MQDRLQSQGFFSRCTPAPSHKSESIFHCSRILYCTIIHTQQIQTVQYLWCGRGTKASAGARRAAQHSETAAKQSLKTSIQNTSKGLKFACRRQWRLPEAPRSNTTNSSRYQGRYRSSPPWTSSLALFFRKNTTVLVTAQQDPPHTPIVFPVRLTPGSYLRLASRG